jgi:hypothetical protein
MDSMPRLGSVMSTIRIRSHGKSRLFRWPFTALIATALAGWGTAIPGCNLFYHCDPPAPIEYPTQATNLTGLNSEWDDWNCAAPFESYSPEDGIVFSSNRYTQGGTFDLTPMSFWIRGGSGFSVEATESFGLSLVARALNTDADELGPTALVSVSKPAWPIDGLVFSRGSSDRHDLYSFMPGPDPGADLIEARTYPEAPFPIVPAPGATITALAPINSAADDGYLTWLGAEGPLLFHSNRDGFYRIWQATLPAGLQLEDWLRSPTAPESLTPVAELSSDGEERCPFIYQGMLVFVSTRSGGFGGWDIYTSKYANGSWSAPTNAGRAVNSAHDEYRPLLTPDFLLFSSNRPGGVGGFDLYLAGMQLRNAEYEIAAYRRP